MIEPKLTPSQRLVLLKLADPNEYGDRLIKGRGPLASANKLEVLGLAVPVKPGYFNGEHWRLTDAGRALVGTEDTVMRERGAKVTHQCARLDPEGRRCRRPADVTVTIFEDRETGGDGWYAVNLCEPHKGRRFRFVGKSAIRPVKPRRKKK